MRTTGTATEARLNIDALPVYLENALRPGVEETLSWDVKQTLLSGLGLNLLEALRYVNQQRPSLEQFEAWILELHGGVIDEAKLNRLRRALAGETVGSEVGSLEGVDRDNPETWYAEKLGHSIWVPLLRHPALVANRRSPRMVKAFAQLWGREDLWANVDQGGLNPPEREGWKFPGPHLHWDTTLVEPHHFGVQGILYLVDVAEDQGAFSCVPGFHKSLTRWLETVPAGVDPRQFAKDTLTLKPIAAKRGDLVLWHQSLPHGSSPNRATRPRVAQYIQMPPTRWAYNQEWR